MSQLFRELPDIMTVDQMAHALNIGKSLAYQLIHRGEIKCLRIGTAIRIPKTSLLAFARTGDAGEGSPRGGASA